jgi:dienelactone hydrolase
MWLPLALLVGGPRLLAEELPFRTWTATNGKQAEARAFGREGGAVALEMRDGRRIKMPLATLSADDRKYVEEAFPPPAAEAAPALSGAEPGLSARTPSLGTSATKPPATKNLADVPATHGKTSDRIPCIAAPEYGYHLWLPPTITAERLWPVMFIMDPGGGKAGTAGRYIPGATFNNFILAVSAESRNSFDDSGKAILAMVADVAARLPVDPARQYSSGFSGGSRMAGWIGAEMSRLPMAGVLCCGASPAEGGIHKLSPKTALYGLCGSNCFNRWDMPTIFAQEPCKDVRLRFFVGRHDWADADMIRDAMVWLNACTLATIARRDATLRAECDSFLGNVLKDAEQMAETAPFRAYELAEISGRFAQPSPALPGLKALFSKLKMNPVVIKELAALADEDKLVAKHFGSWYDYKKGADPKASEAAVKLAEKHAGTLREPVLRKLAEPCVQP